MRSAIDASRPHTGRVVSVHSEGVPHRLFLSGLGEPAVCTVGYERIRDRADQFIGVAGLNSGQLHLGPVAAFPLPALDGEWWVPSSFLWCPLAWLPAELAAPPSGFRLIPDTQVRMWEATVALALETSGLYSPRHGWEDVAVRYGREAGLPGWYVFDRDEVATQVRHRLLDATDPAAAERLVRGLPARQAALAEQLADTVDRTDPDSDLLADLLRHARTLVGDLPAGETLTGDVLLSLTTQLACDPDDRTRIADCFTRLMRAGHAHV